MNYKQLELRSESVFKDAVINAAEARGMEIVAEATKKSQDEIRAAHLLCDEADHALIAADMSLAAEREFSTLAQQAKNELLQHRTKLVDEMFFAVQVQLQAFVLSKEYPAFLAAHLKSCAANFAPDACLTVRIRQEDMKHEKMLKKAWPKCEIVTSKQIRIGGLTVQDEHRLYNETLDAALQAEQEAFYAGRELTL